MRHLTLEFCDIDGGCRVCGTRTVLVTVSQWKTHPEDEDEDDEFVEPDGEVSGHYCPNCNRLTAIYLNDVAGE